MITRHEVTGRLSKVLVANGFAFLSGLTAKDRSGGVKEQTADILAQIDGYLALGELGLDGRLAPVAGGRAPGEAPNGAGELGWAFWGGAQSLRRRWAGRRGWRPIVAVANG